MVIRGRTRGNSRQLGTYLLETADNDNVQILDVDGRLTFTSKQLKDTLLAMSLTSELTKSDKGLYHAQINPAYGEDSMTPDQWLTAADMLANELGLQEQRRIIVLHEKKGRTHAHVVWERYDHEKKKMVSDSFSRLAQDRARQAMEQVFEMKKTPIRNEQRPEMKQALSKLWKLCRSGSEFINKAKLLGYTIAAGVQRRPFMVVDFAARSFDLVRQLEGVKTKEVRERLGKQKLIDEKKAIESIRQTLSNDNDKVKGKALAFAMSRDEMLKKEGKPIREKDIKASLFAENREDFLSDKEASRKQQLLELEKKIQQNKKKQFLDFFR